MTIIRVIILCFLFCTSSWASVLFESDFDGSGTWTHQQDLLGSSNPYYCVNPGSCGTIDGWQAWYDGYSYCGSVGNNTLHINSGAGYPVDSESCYSGTNCLTFWVEGCNYSAFEDSDGNYGVWFTESYTVYVGFRIRFDTTFSYPTEGRQIKLFHLQHNASGNPWSYFSDPDNLPLLVLGLYRYSGNIWVTMATRCSQNYYCDGTPAYNQDYANDYDAVSLGSVATILNDGQWHQMIVRMTVNTGSVGNMNADGVMQFWYDGSLKATYSDVVMNDNSSSARRGYNFYSQGGNNNLGVASEQWYAVDDVVIATTYAEAAAGPTGSDTTAPTVTISTTDPSTITSDSLTVTGTASDAVGVSACKYRLGAAPDASNGTACTGTTSWSCSTSGFSPGANTLYVGCGDAAGNWGSASITVTRGDLNTSTCTISKASLFSFSGCTLTGGTSLAAEAGICDPTDFYVWIDSAEPVSSTPQDVGGLFRFSMDLSALSNASHTLRIRSRMSGTQFGKYVRLGITKSGASTCTIDSAYNDKQTKFRH